ncbi:MAG: 50S ribosomal protein L3 [Legionellales bacterium]|nr:50S ribosomal protein L3 [Legionellales bacterium]|tara:strand:- start:1173 stop:1838 length:666 start_codon:yes stop_codon:yes gene_type:complete
MLGLLGQKIGMTRVFTPEGKSVAVTVIQVLPNRVTQVKTQNNDGYAAIQVTTGEKRVSRMSKPEAGHFAKNEVAPGRLLKEFTSKDGSDFTDVNVGDELTVELIAEGAIVDVTATSKGKGFAGGVKRHNFRTQDASHGNSLSHRVVGSTGQNQTPGRVFKGKKMPGQMGNVKTTVQSLTVVKVDAQRQVVLVNGSVPGAPGGEVIIRPAAKKPAADTTSAA